MKETREQRTQRLFKKEWGKFPDLDSSSRTFAALSAMHRKAIQQVARKIIATARIAPHPL